MANAATVHLPPPKDWDAFEDMCADTFQNLWGDHNATRYGRQGQRQNGVDIYGSLAGGGVAGVQCKGRRSWPPPKLTIEGLNVEVEKAKGFEPKLAEFTVATINADDAKLQDRARELTVEHQKQGLFRVHVIGWGELTRKLTQFPNLLEKHYSFTSLGTLLTEIPERAAQLIAEQFGRIDFGRRSYDEHRDAMLAPPIDEPELIAASERDLASQYELALKRSLFPETAKTDRFAALGEDLASGKYGKVSPSLRRRVLLRAARSAAVRGVIDAADRFLAAAVELSGPDSDILARARLAEARGEIDSALLLLRDRRDADSRSTLLNVLFRHRGADAALQWFNENGMSVADLTANGLHSLSLIHLQADRTEAARDALAAASEAIIEEAPYFLLLRGTVRLACLLPKPDQALPLQGLPLDVRSARVIVSETVATEQLELAITDLTRLQPIARHLQLQQASRIAVAYLLWCQLLHPHRKARAVAQLCADMSSPETALDKLQFAFVFIKDFDSSPVAQYLARREQLGGLADDELRAALVLRMHGDDPKAVAALIARHREALEAAFGRSGVLSLEIQALILAGDVATASVIIDQNRALFDHAFVSELEAEIANAKGADPVQEYLRVFEETGRTEALRALVRELSRKNDHGALARYAEELYRHTNDPQDIALAAEASHVAGDHANFVRVVEAHAFLLVQYPSITRDYGWELFRLGRLDEAGRQTEYLRAHAPSNRALQLEIAIAIETGEWELLAQPLAAHLEMADRLKGTTLIRAAQTAQASGHGPMMDLLKAAIQKSGSDPEVLLGAYLLTIDEGIEGTLADAQEWFRRAVDLSGEDGPVRRFELKELLNQQSDWNQQSRTVNDGIARGDLPLVIAAPSLRMTLVEAILGNLVRNAVSTDPRRMAAIPLFSGRRAPDRLGEARRIAIDATSLLVLGWLGLLPKVLSFMPEIVLPAGALLELFEGRRRIRSFQKSRLKRATQIRDAIAARRVSIAPAPSPDSRSLADEIGVDLAALVHAADAAGGVVLRPAPVHRIGLDMEDADMSSHAALLADMHGLLEVLVDLGGLDEATEETAKGYFLVQDRGWPMGGRPDVKRPLFIDDLALNYLQTTNLFDSVLDQFSEVYIEASAEREATTLIEHDRHVGDVLHVIDEIRAAVRSARTAGKIIFGPRRSGGEDNEKRSDLSTIHLLYDLCDADAVVFDDRALNKEPFAQDRTGYRARIVTSLDLIEELFARELVTEAERRTARHRLRVAGAMLMPIDADEIANAVLRSRRDASREFRALRENLDLARIADFPRFPAEVAWLATLAIETKSAIMQIWQREEDAVRAAALSDLVMELAPQPEAWLACWTGNPPPGWAGVVKRMIPGRLAMPFELGDIHVLNAYHRWLESKIFEPMRQLSPDFYREIIDFIRSLILNSEDAENEDDAAI
ncbi:tetratricopeptide (TPR) repeat protein [Inquilinus ginsengisoli]|uniref:HTH domain-containing protein n=1 Tax=Inquilinus ginsengisoli TaxID=363840 RepID=UPI003D1B66D4